VKRIVSVLVLCAALGGCVTVGSEATSAGLLSLDEAIERSAAELAAELPAGTRVAIAGFTSEHENLSNYIMDELTGALVDGDLEVADRRNLAYVYKELDFQMTGDVSDEAAVPIGKFLGAQYVITGQLVKAGGRYRYRLSGVNVETAAQESSARLDVREDGGLYRLIADLRDYTGVTVAAAYERPSAQPQTAGAFLDRGLFFARAGDFDSAIADYTGALRLDPNNAAAYNNRGKAYTGKGMTDKAIEDHSAALRVDPAFVNAYNNRGIAYKTKGMLDEAIEDYTAALRVNPDYAAAYNNRGIAYNDKGMRDEAIEDYNAALRINPAYAYAYNNRGKAYSGKGMLDEAIEDFTAALRVDPAYAVAWYNRGNAYNRKGMLDEAIEDYTAALRADPDYAHAYNNRGAAYFNKGDYRRARADYEKSLQIDPANTTAWKNLEEVREWEELNGGAYQ
jgi:tetratricopeptide (TPR) repeat protein